MGRAFEYRKARKMKRWAGMAKAFTKVGREIAIAVKEGGGDPDYNPRLRMAIQKAKAVNMPKANIENAIKKALGKDSANYDELVYEGYAPHGIAVLVETATDNSTRTVANVRHVFSKYGGSLGTSGSVDYMFSRKGIFTIKKEDVNDPEEFELELIDHGLEEIKSEDGDYLLYCDFADYGALSKALHDMGIEATESNLDRIPSHTKKLSDEQVDEVIKLIDKMEEEEDVLQVFHTMDMSE
ncbi:MAG TPA: YebC/PmpR family DNA-binding transcriptional regulator [Bacteroidetes bacterium]|nr:YebC/PmpR family DNA-binding transcriptional regulator [Bacteroidota bacterium]